jgi:hypothetical protein
MLNPLCDAAVSKSLIMYQHPSNNSKKLVCLLCSIFSSPLTPTSRPKMVDLQWNVREERETHKPLLRLGPPPPPHPHQGFFHFYGLQSNRVSFIGNFVISGFPRLEFYFFIWLFEQERTVINSFLKSPMTFYIISINLLRGNAGHNCDH